MHAACRRNPAIYSVVWMTVACVAFLALLFAPLAVAAEAAPTLGMNDLGDLDPALFPLLAALLHVKDAPGVGALQSVTGDGTSLTLRFTGLVVMVPAGQPDGATVPPLVSRLLDRRSPMTLIAGSEVTYGTLTTTAPRAGSSTLAPLLLNASGSLSPMPAGVLPASLATPQVQMIGGYHVPQPFIGIVVPNLPPRVTARTPEAVAQQALDLARAGMPLREPVWIRLPDGYRLVQPFTRRVLIWDPTTNEVSATDLGEVALVTRLVPDDRAGGPLVAAMMLRLISVDPGIGVAMTYTTPRGVWTLSVGGETRYPAASVMKLAILAACEDAIARGDLTRDADLDAREEAMIVYSDNDAANELIDVVGRTRINDLMRRLGMTQSYIGSHFDDVYGDDDDDNYLTPRESLLLMNALVRGEIGDGQRIRDLLSRSEAPGSVHAAFTDANISAIVYEKRGWYDNVENDVVRIELGSNTAITITIFQPDVDDSETAWALFADLARIGLERGGR